MNLSTSPQRFWHTAFALTFIVNLVILAWSISRWVELKVILWRSVWAIPLALYIAVLVGCIFLFMRIQKGGADSLVSALELERLNGPFWRIAGAALFVAVLWAIPWLKFTFRVGEVVKRSTQDPVLTMIVFYWAVWWLLLLAAAGLKVAFKTSWPGGFAAALVVLGVAYELFIRAQDVSTYPFSLGWSETSRFYYSSLYFAESVYGMQPPLSTLHPTRYLLQSLPFLIPGLDLTASRLWQVILWIGLTAAAAIAITWRAFSAPPARGEAIGGAGVRWLFAGWLFLFLLRVGVYYHLEIMVLLPVLFVSARHPSRGKRQGLWRSLAAVALASAWAGVSRVNWFPMPAMLAAAIYLMEEPINLSPQRTQRDTKENLKTLWLYIRWPMVWGIIGVLTALAAQTAYIPLSGNAENARAFASSFSSDLLWHRLWPNDSFPLGVVLAILIVSGPLLVVIALGRPWRLHPIRWLGLLTMLAGLFVGGLVVSVKIGGGADLHNMDAYAVLVSLVAAYFIGDKVRGESESDEGQGAASARPTIPWRVTALALLIPLIFLVPALSPFAQFNEKANRAAFVQLKTLAEQAARKGPVLFINERQLVTFGQADVALIPEYEAVTLMEMAMSNNQSYLQRFYTDLRSHRFAAIVAGKQNIGTKEEGAFAEENNVWNERVSPYILCYYEPAVEIEADESKIEFYVPRTVPGNCP